MEYSLRRSQRTCQVNDLINKYADELMTMSLVSTQDQGVPPRRAVLLMLRRLESQCTGGARESEEVKGGKREGG